jgi:3-isopropylmalate/(R)-2-methylmalate dehydratase small subunit
MSIYQGRARKFGDNVDTDSITPGSFLHLPMEELVHHAFSPLRPEFDKTLQPHDVIVAGKNYGCGSSREQATSVVKALGFDFVVCESMARIYLRNCTAVGVYPVLAPGASALFDEGDPIEIDTGKGEVRNPRTGKVARFYALTGIPQEILEAGGIIPLLNKKVEEAKARRAAQ